MATPSGSTYIDTSPLHRDIHNLIVTVVTCLLVAWAARVLLRLLTTIDLKLRLAQTQPLQLESMSLYANDFQLLIRQHFNQILRIRRTVPPRPLSRYSMSVHVHPESLSVCSGSTSASESAEGPAAPGVGSFGVKFEADALAPCSVRLYWGVSAAACSDFVHRYQQTEVNEPPSSGRGRARGGRSVVGGWPSRSTANADSQRSLLEMEEIEGPTAAPCLRPGAGAGDQGGGVFLPGQYSAHSRDFFLPPGLGQSYATPAGDLVQSAQLPFDMTAAWLRSGSEDGSAVMPLVIVAMAQPRPSHTLGEVQGQPVQEANGQVSFVRFRNTDEVTGAPRSPEVVRQISFCTGAAYELQGVYGFEDEGEGECMICYNRPKSVLMMPCRHCSVCHPCLRSLRDEKCPLCRATFTSYVTLPICRSTPPTPPILSSGSTPPPAPSGAGGNGSGGGGGGSGGSSAGAGGSVGNTTASAGAAAGNAGATTPAAPNSASAAPSTSQPPATKASTISSAPPSAVVASATPATGAAGNHDVRQARDLSLGRPRGAAPRAAPSHPLRFSGRARFGVAAATDNADTPLLSSDSGSGGGVPGPARGVDVAGDAGGEGPLPRIAAALPTLTSSANAHVPLAEEARVLIAADGEDGTA
eukprot:TRINITY_DN46646_c0_g1_i1.p1 TRINITY_DN46646_c0_g1~~TRINITY_DN46646_c0_g1_i1.p1  ORF type:complete len:660 (-),score=64.20 TRINITY_DN46646_c0_g1_i1:81-2000(-)